MVRRSQLDHIGFNRSRAGRAASVIAILPAVAFAFFHATADAHAAPVRGDLFQLRQPDGAMVAVRIWGDEFYQIVESPNGYTLVRDPDTEEICYADVSADGTDFLSTGVVVGTQNPAGLGLVPHMRINAGALHDAWMAGRALFAEGVAETVEGLGFGPGAPMPAPPSMGSVVGVTLVVDFSDEVGTVAVSEIDNYLNQIGYTGNGNNGSVRDYYFDVSDGNLDYTNNVPAVYYRAAHPKTYYDANEAAGPKARELVLEALNALETAGHDFSQYDANADGFIDAVNLFYAGTPTYGFAKGLWPHQWSLSPTFMADGKTATAYQITNIGTGLTLATFCHETGHLLFGWHDLYDVDGGSNGVGLYDLMGYTADALNPQEPGAYLKELAGWANINLLTAPASSLTLVHGTNTFYKYVNPGDSNEFFIIENRRQSARDAALPDAGIAVWHIDLNKSGNAEQQRTAAQHYEASLEQADGLFQLETTTTNYGDAGDLYRAGGVTGFNAATTPDSGWWDGTDSNLAISNVSAAGSTMTFDFDNGAGVGLDLSVDTIASQAAGVAFDVGVSVLDVFGDAGTVSSDTRVTLTLKTGTGTLGGTVFTTISSGMSSGVISGVSYDTPESGVVLTATASGGDALTAADSNAFTVGIGPPSTLTVDTLATQTAGSSFDVTVNVEDNLGNPAGVTAITLITLSRNAGTGSVSGTITGVLNTGESSVTVSGVQYDTAETGVQLRAAASGPGGGSLAAGTSNSFDVVPGTGTTLSIGTIASPQIVNAPFDVGVSVVDDLGNPTTVAADTTVTLSVAAGTGTLSGTVSGVIPAGSGAFTISGAQYNKIENNVQVRATATGLTSATSNAFNVGVGAASAMIVSNIAAQRAGIGFDVGISTRDAFGNTSAIAGDTAVTLSVATGTGSLGGATMGTLSNGSSSFTISGVTYDTVETGVVLNAAATGLGNTDSNAFDVTAGIADRLAITTIGTQGVDVPFDVVVSATDPLGNPSAVLSDTTIALTKKSGSSAIGTAGGNLSAVMSTGQSMVTISGVTWDTIEMGVELTATASGGDTLTAVDSNMFDVELRSATKLSIDTIADHAGGTPFSVTVNVLDASDLAAAVSQDTQITLSVMTGTGTLFGNLSGTIAAGAQRVTLSGLDYSVAQSGIVLTATATAGDTLTAANSNAFTVTAGPARIITPADGSMLTGTSVTFNWNTGANVTQYRLWVGTAPLNTSSDADIFVSTALTGTSQAVTGIPTTGGTIYVKLFSYINGAFQNNSYTYTAPTAGVATHLLLPTINTQTAGTPFAVTVQSADALGTPSNVTQDTGVALSLMTGTGALGGTLTGTIANGTNSVALSGLTYDTAETGVVLTATRTAGDALQSANSNAFDVNGGAASKLSIATIADQGTNVGFDVVVSLLDAGDNASVATQATTVTLTKRAGNSAAGTIAGVTTGAVAPGSGSVTITGVEWDADATGAEITATATAGMTGLTPADSNTFDVATRTATKLLITTIPNQGRDVPFDVTVIAADASDNIATVSQDTQITLSLDVGMGTLGGVLTGTIANGGSTVTISGVTYDQFENNIAIDATPTTGMTGLTPVTSNPFNVTTAKATLTNPANNGDTLTGASFTFQWTTGAGVTQYRLWVGSGPMTDGTDADIYKSVALTGTSQLVTGLPTDGSNVYVRLFSYINGAFEQADYTFVAASAGVATHLELAAIGTQVAGTPFSVGVGTVDALGDPAAVAQDTRVALSVQSGTGTVGGTTYGTIANGMSSFTISGVTYDAAEAAVVLRATSVMGDALIAADSAAFTVNGGAASKLSIATIADQGTNVGFDVVVSVLDANDNQSVATQATTVTLTKRSGNSAAGTIAGVTTGVIDPGSGSVTITGVEWDADATGAEITATPTAGMTGLTPADSNAFNVTTRTPTKLAFSTIGNQGTGLPFDITVRALDAGDQPANVTSATQVTLSVNNGAGMLGGVVTGTIANGESTVTISGATYSVDEDGVTLDATPTTGMTGLSVATSNAFDVGAAKAAMTTPAMDGDTLTGTTFTFEWNTGSGVAHYRLWVGTGPMTTVADADIHNSGPLTTTSRTVSGIPGDGSNVYVRLYSYINGAFQQNDYIYVAPTAGAATHLQVVNIGNQTAGTSFDVGVRVVDALGDPATVSQDTGVALSVQSGGGSIGGTTAGTIAGGSGGFTISGVTYDAAETGVVLRATTVAGDSLVSANSNAFTVSGGPATKLSVAMIADQGTNVAFSVTVNVLDTNDNASVATQATTVTLTKRTGSAATGTIAGVTTSVIQAGEGSVTINGVEWDSASTNVELTATATSGQTGLTAANSNTFDVSTRTPTKLAVDPIGDQGKDQPFDVTVRVLDAADAPANVTQLTTITLSLQTGTGALGGVLSGTIAATNGEATISGVTYDKLENGVVLTASTMAGDSLTAANSNAFLVGNAPAVMTNPANDGDTLTGSTVTFTWTTGFGVTQYRLWVADQPMTTVADANIYSSLALTGTSQTVGGLPMDGRDIYVRLFSFINGAFQTRDYTYVAASAGQATRLAMATISAQQAGVPFSVGVQAVDAFGAASNVSTDTGVSISLAVGTGNVGGTITGTIVGGAGAVTISGITYDTVESGVELRANRVVGDLLAAGTSNAFTVNAGSPAAMNFQAIGAQGAGDPFSATIEVIDQFGNLTNATQDTLITITKSPATSATGTLTASQSGTVSMGSNSVTIGGLSWDTVETGVQLRATASGGDTLTAADSAAFDVGIGAPSALAIATIADQNTGANFAVRVNVEDSLGNPSTATQDTTITLTKQSGSSATGTLGGTRVGTLVGGAPGVTISGLTWDAADTGVVLTASASNGDTLSAGASNSFTVTIGAAVDFTLGNVSGVQAGQPFSVVVTARDQFGNAAAVSADTGVALTRMNGTGTLGGVTTGTIALGSSTFTIAGVTYSKKENNVRLTATITGGDNLGAPTDTNFFNVAAGPAASLGFQSVATQQAGEPFELVVIPRDQFGNQTNVATDTRVTLSKKAGSAASGTLGTTLTGSLTGTITAGTNSRTFSNVTWSSVSTGAVVTATRLSGDALTAGDSNAFNVSAGPPSQLGMTIANQAAGEPFTVTVEARDSVGGPAAVTQDTVVTLSKTSGSSAGGTLIPGAGGLSGTILAGQTSVAIVNLRWNVMETGVQLTATRSSGNSLSAGMSHTLAVTEGPPAQLAFGTVGGQTAGTPFDVGIIGQDQFGNTSALLVDTRVTISRATGTGTVGGTLTGTFGVGQTTFTISGVNYDVAESGVSLRATASLGFPLTAGISNTFTVAPGAPAGMSIDTVGTQAAGIPFDVVVRATDPFGNETNVTQNTSVQLSRASGTGSLTGTLAGVIANGTSSVSISGVRYDKAESGVVLTATRTGGHPFGPVNSNAFTCTGGTATALAIATIPDRGVNLGFDVVVSAIDAFGNPSTVATDTGVVLTRKSGIAATGAVGGNLTGTILGGAHAVTISGVGWDTVETGVQLTATRTSGDTLTAADSNAFEVLIRPPTQLGFAPITTQVVNVPFDVVVEVQDANGDPTAATQDTNVTISLKSGGGALGGVLTATIPLGSSTFTFSNLTYNTIQSGVVLLVTRNTGNVLTAGESSPFNVAAGVKAAMTSPANGSTLSGDSETFTWTTGVNVAQYRLWVGTQPLNTATDANIYKSSALSGTSQLVTGIPTDSGTIHVRLYSYINGVFESNDYTYTAASMSPPAPQPEPAPQLDAPTDEGEPSDDAAPVFTPEQLIGALTGGGFCGMGGSMSLALCVLSLCGMTLGRRRIRRGRRASDPSHWSV